MNNKTLNSFEKESKKFNFRKAFKGKSWPITSGSLEAIERSNRKNLKIKKNKKALKKK
jgi:hypothetical protein